MEKRSVEQAAELSPESSPEPTVVTAGFAAELETAIAASNWGEVCKLAERSFFIDQSINRSVDQPSNQPSDRTYEIQIRTQMEAQVLDGLLQALEWGDFQVRWEVSKLLPKLGNAAIAPLLNRLNDPLNDPTDSDEEVQWFIVRTLGAWEDDGVMVALLEVLRSGNPDVQSMAATVLAQYGDRSLTVLKPMLETGLETASWSLWAVRILANLRTVETVEMLLELAVHPDTEVCCTAIAALANFQDNRIAVVLIQALKSPVARIRETAAESIAFCQTLSDDRRIELLTPLLWDLNGAVCIRSATSLGRLGTHSTESLLRALKSHPLPDALAIELVRSLLRIETVEALIGLFKASQTMSLVRTEVLRALGRVSKLKDIAVTYLIELIQQNLTLNDRKLAVTALGNLAQPDAIDGLLDQFITVDSSLRFHILQALQHIDRTSPEPIVRATIQQKIQDIGISAELKSGLQFALDEWR